MLIFITQQLYFEVSTINNDTYHVLNLSVSLTYFK